MALTPPQEKIARVHAQRKAAEEQLRAAYGVAGQVPRDQPLVDKDGYPLAGVDVYSIRIARNQIAVLENDIKGYDAELHRLVVEVNVPFSMGYRTLLSPSPPLVSVRYSCQVTTKHPLFITNLISRTHAAKCFRLVLLTREQVHQSANPADNRDIVVVGASSSTPGPPPQQTTTLPSLQTQAFLMVSEVQTQSPAARHGLVNGDRVSLFGTVVATNFTSLTDISSVLKNTSPGEGIPVHVVRNGVATSLTLRLGEDHHLGCKVDKI